MADQLMDRYIRADTDLLHRQLAGFFEPESRILEVGCGSGKDADFMLTNGYDILAVDASRSMLRGAVKNFPGLAGRTRLIIVPDCLRELDSESFDGIYSIAMLMHLKENQIRRALCEFARILKNNGRLFFSVCLTRDSELVDDVDADGRRYTLRSAEWWQSVCETADLNVIKTDVSDDRLGRAPIQWLNLYCSKPMPDTVT
jgi:cyclopropane fatty-acyl-phospholipid synthase-like methyltransferase